MWREIECNRGQVLFYEDCLNQHLLEKIKKENTQVDQKSLCVLKKQVLLKRFFQYQNLSSQETFGDINFQD